MTNGQEFRHDQIAKNFTQEEWNQMYNSAATQADTLTILWNKMYTATSHEAVVFYNKMYEAVISGKKLSDPELQKEVDAWNYSQSAKFRTSLAIG